MLYYKPTASPVFSLISHGWPRMQSGQHIIFCWLNASPFITVLDLKNTARWEKLIWRKLATLCQKEQNKSILQRWYVSQIIDLYLDFADIFRMIYESSIIYCGELPIKLVLLQNITWIQVQYRQKWKLFTAVKTEDLVSS